MANTLNLNYLIIYACIRWMINERFVIAKWFLFFWHHTPAHTCGTGQHYTGMGSESDCYSHTLGVLGFFQQNNRKPPTAGMLLQYHTWGAQKKKKKPFQSTIHFSLNFLCMVLQEVPRFQGLVALSSADSARSAGSLIVTACQRRKISLFLHLI